MNFSISSRKSLGFGFVVSIISMFAGCSGNSGNGIAGSGTIEATEVNVASKIGGQVVKLYVDEGSLLKDSDMIAEIDHANLDIQLEEANASLAQAQAQDLLSKEGARPEDIKGAQDALDQVTANEKLAEIDLRRTQSLVAQDAATKQDADDAQTKLDALQAQVQQAKENVAKMQRFTRPAELEAANARVQQLMATRDRIKQQIGDCMIVSPLAGVVTHKVVEQGEVVGAGATIATVTEISKVELVIYVTEEELPKVKLGQKAKVWIDGMPEKTYQGTVVYISPEAEFTPKNIQTKDDRTKLVFGVKLDIPDPKAELKRGLPADAEIELH